MKNKKENNHIVNFVHAHKLNKKVKYPEIKGEYKKMPQFIIDKQENWEGDTLDTIIRDYTSVAYIKSKSELRRRIENIIRKEKEESYREGRNSLIEELLKPPTDHIDLIKPKEK